mmetsp:Transcript_62064/g.145640  ORF Transcript_62064/g.145640 Transcript_62064/m.145640 type:complete len:280 (-) Transcript_62064:125-964(-)
MLVVLEIDQSQATHCWQVLGTLLRGIVQKCPEGGDIGGVAGLTLEKLDKVVPHAILLVMQDKAGLCEVIQLLCFLMHFGRQGHADQFVAISDVSKLSNKEVHIHDLNLAKLVHVGCHFVRHRGFHRGYLAVAFQDCKLLLHKLCRFFALTTHLGHRLHLLRKLLHGFLVQMGAGQGLADRCFKLSVRNLLCSLSTRHLHSLHDGFVVIPLGAELFEAYLGPDQSHHDFCSAHLVESLQLPVIRLGIHHSLSQTVIDGGNNLGSLLFGCRRCVGLDQAWV